MSESMVREGPRKHIIQAVAIGIIFTALSYVLGLSFGWVDKLDWLEVFAVFTSYASTYLCVVERRINYVFGAISSLAYALLFYKADLFASTTLNLYLAPTLIYGWIVWKRDVVTRPVEHVKAKMIPVYLGIAGIGWYGAVLLLGALGASLAWTDSAILAATILAQFLLDRKKLENWFVWAVVNVFAIYTYATAGLALVAFQYVLFLANTIYGYIMWRRSMHKFVPEQPAQQAVLVEA